jgi:hypothetical protein
MSTGVGNVLPDDGHHRHDHRRASFGGWWSPYNLDVTAQDMLNGQQWVSGFSQGDPGSGDQPQPGADGGDAGVGSGGMTV